MANITISISPGTNGYSYSNITAEGEPSEVDKIIEGVDKLMNRYPILKPESDNRETKSVFPRR